MKTFMSRHLLLAAATLAAAASAHAANTWTNPATGGLWSTSTNWDTVPVDGVTGTANFSTLNITADNTVHMDGAHTLNSLSFADATTVSNNWILDNNGNAANILTLDGTTPTITVTGSTATAGFATISAEIAGTVGLTKAGNGLLILSGANTYTGTTAVSAGTLIIAGANASNAVTVASGAFLDLKVANALASGATITSTGTASVYVADGLTTNYAWTANNGTSRATLALGNGANFAGNITLTGVDAGGASLNFQSGATSTISGNISTAGVIIVRSDAGTTFSGSPVLGVTLIGSAASTVTLSGVISDNAANKGGVQVGTGNSSSTVTLSGINTFTGVVKVANGTLNFSTIKNIGDVTGSSLGNATASTPAIALGENTTAGTLKYTGTGNTTDRVINLAGTTGGGTLDQSGTGLLKFTSNFTATGLGAKTLTLAGSTAGTGEIAGAIVNSTGFTTAVTKSGTGTWTLSGANTYTGVTTIGGGTLALAGGNDRLATTGTVNFSAAGTLNLGSTSQSLANLTVAGATTATVNGTGGTLSLTGASFALNSSSSQTLNMGGLTTFTYNNTAGTFKVAASSNSGAGVTSALTLAGTTNTITALNFIMGDFGGTVNSSNNVSNITLGASNTINADLIQISGGSRSNATLQSAAGTTLLKLRGKDTTSAVNSMIVGTSSGPASPATQQGNLTLNNGTLDALVTNLVIGQNTRGGSAGGNAVINTGTFTMGGGTLDASNITLGQVLTGFTNAGTTSSTTGTLTVNGGTVKVNNLYFADQQASAATSSLVGVLNLNSGANLYAANIAKGTGTGTGGTTRTFNWNSGTIHNYDASTDLTIASGFTAFNVTGAGTHAFDIDSGRTATVNQAMSGAGALTKLGSGALALKANNSTFSGGITVNAGSLVTGHVSALGSGSVNVAAGTLQVGDGSANTVTLGASANLVIADGATLKLGGLNALSLSNTGVASGTGVIALTGGTYNFGSTGAGLLDLGGALNNLGAGDYKYTLITGTLSGNDLSEVNILGSGYDSSVTNLSYANGVLSFTAVPEPSTYGLIGAGTLAAVAFVRRRRKLAGKVA